MSQRQQMLKVHVSPGPVCQNHGCPSIFEGGWQTEGSIQKLGPEWHLYYFDLKKTVSSLMGRKGDAKTMT